MVSMLTRVSADVCVRCKGYRRLCGLKTCPIIERFRFNVKATLSIKGREVKGATPPSVVVGESGYPKVSVILNVPPNVFGSEAKDFEDPLHWWGRLRLNDIIRRRSSMISLITKLTVNNAMKLYEREISVAAASVRPVDGEALLESSPRPRLMFNAGLDPLGPSAKVKYIKIVGNPVLPKQLESMIWDDLPAFKAVEELYAKGVDIYTIIRSLSLGLLGRIRKRRLVPTRWAITAVDRVLTKHLLKRIRYFKDIGSVELYVNEYLGNRFIVILYPGRPVIEWIEIWHPLSVFTKGASEPVIVYNRSNPLGETISIDGGFDAARLAVVESLARRGRRASAIILREVTPDYYVSVGNWHIRETMRRALRDKPETLCSLHEAVERAVHSLRVSIKARHELIIKSLIKSLSNKGLESFSKEV